MGQTSDQEDPGVVEGSEGTGDEGSPPPFAVETNGGGRSRREREELAERLKRQSGELLGENDELKR